MADVVEINSLDQLQSYRMVWNNLFRQTPRASFFHTFDWLGTYWRHFGQNQRLKVLIIRSTGVPIGIAPLCVRTENFRAGSVRTLTYPIHDWGTWYGPIGPNPSATMFMAMQHIRDTPRDWDLMELRWSDAQRSDRTATLRAMQAAGFQPRKSGHHQVSIIHFDGDWASYLASKKSKWRSKLKRQHRAIERCGAVEFIRYRPLGTAYGDGDPRWDLFDACREVSQHSWQGSSKTGTTLSHDQIRSYIQETHADAARLGMLDLTMLTVGGQPAAFTYNYHFDGLIYGLRMGYNAAISKQGLGNVLMTRSIKDSFERGDKSQDMGVGENRFKQEFRTGMEISFQFTHYPWLAARSQAVRLSRWLKRTTGMDAPVAPNGKEIPTMENAAAMDRRGKKSGEIDRRKKDRGSHPLQKKA